ncbi:hypothetical protein UA32_12195 [Photobacterium angustum]|uniref:DUF4165 domain-containing protein n=1 Tax=Photobacterium angustum TaxID=661 RepID=A0ABX5GYH1_PHOAN|nr:Ig-like domain-containing protein [Photobacterium angustum]KJG37715.1 hypothetical protein UA32_12195 [Photobacterium angustum]PSX03952.1 DUF4165 domain-containing protein [Photobacterium angustum]
MFRRIFGLVLLCGVSSTQAAIEYTQFKDINGSNVTPDLVIDETLIVNNVNNITVMFSAGLDRKVQLRLTNMSGTALHESTSGVISINDKITVDNKVFFGKTFNFPIDADGQYKLTINTLNLSGNVVNSETYRINRDTSPPTAGEITKYVWGGTSNELTPADVWYTGYWRDNYFQLNNINDIDSGIEKVSLVSYVFDRDVPKQHKVKDLPFDSENNLARFSFPSDPAMWPTNDNADTLFAFNFRVTDNAGNILNTPLQKMYYDTVKAEGLELIAVRQPNSNNSIAGRVGYVPYVPGMTVYENPISFMYRIPKNSHINYHRGGYGPIGSAEQITDYDNDYVYVIFKRTFGFTDGNYIRFADRGEWASSYVRYNLVLSSSAPQSPTRVRKAEYLYSDIGWSSWTRWHIQESELPLEIRGSRQLVEARTYDQIWSHEGESCIIPAGHTICEIIYDNPRKLSKGSSHYFHHGSSINSVDNQLIGPPGWADVTYNSEHAPIFTSAQLNGTVLTANISQPSAGSWFDNLRLRTVWIQDQKGNRLDIATDLKRNGTEYESVWELSNLPEGDYQLSIYAQEMHGLITKYSETYDFVNDKTSPNVSIGYRNEFNQVPDTISELRDLKITVKDDVSPVYIDNLKIKSTDGVVNVNLGYSLISEESEGKSKVFSPELPRLFPSLQEGKEYELVVSARDQFDNTRQTLEHFSFIPSNLIVMDTQLTLPVNSLLKDATNQSLTLIHSEHELVMEDGRNATGEQHAIVTLSPSSEYPVIVSGIVVSPGASEQIAIDLGDAGGKLNVPVTPQFEGADSDKIELMFEIPSLSSKYE